RSPSGLRSAEADPPRNGVEFSTHAAVAKLASLRPLFYFVARREASHTPIAQAAIPPITFPPTLSAAVAHRWLSRYCSVSYPNEEKVVSPPRSPAAIASRIDSLSGKLWSIAPFITKPMARHPTRF